MKGSLRLEIKKNLANYSRVQKRLAVFLIEHWAEIPMLSIEAISKKAGVSMASITRFARKFAGKGFYDFKSLVKNEQMTGIINPVQRFFSLPDNVHGKKSLIKSAHQDVKNINRLLATVSEEKFLRLVTLVETADRVFSFGIGISSIFSNLMAYTFNQIQKETHSLDQGNIPVEEKIFQLKKSELIVFFSFFPYSKCTGEFARLAHDRGVPMVLFSDNEYSPLSRYASLIITAPRENILFTTSISAFSVLLNAVAAEVALKKKDVLERSLKEMDRQLRAFYL